MNKRFAILVKALLLVPCFATAVRAADDVEAILKQMPADFPLGAVVVNFEKFDKSIVAYARAINPKTDFGGPLADIKKDSGIGPWIDFTKPMGFAQPSIQGGDPVIWASVPGFKEKIKTVADAKEEEGGIWFLPFEGSDDLYVTQKGDLVISAGDKTLLESALRKEGRTLADDLRPRLDLLKNRDVYIHLNFDPIRPMALGAIAQGAQAGPMMAMMMAQQGGGDPASMTAVFTGIIDAAKKFAEQVAYVDIVVGVTEATVNGTIATGFKDGEIKNYLAKTKPASAPLLSTLEEQPFTVAMGWNIPGDESPFLSYFFDKLGTGAPGGGEKSASAEASNLARDLYRKVEGMNLVVNMSKEGMTSAGDYVGKDAAGIHDLAKKSMVKESPLAEMMSSGIDYEAAGTKKLGDKTVDAFTIKIDDTKPSAAQAKQMFGPNTTLYMAPVDGRVAYYMGPEDKAQKFFTGKVQKPLTSSALVADAIKNLPPKQNMVMLFDIAGVLPALGGMLPMPMPENIPPGPPIAVSVSLSGDYARTDVHVPAKAISRVVEAVTPQPPM